MAVQQKTLSNRTVAALKVARDTVFWDRDLTGFGVRVYPTGGKVYIAQARGPDGPKRVTVGRHDVLHADQARQRAALIIARIKAGEEPMPLPLAARANGGPTVADLAARYLEEHVEVKLKPNTQRQAALRAPPPHPPRTRQDATRRNRAGSGRRSTAEAVRPPVHGEQGRQGPVAHVPPGRGLGHGAGRLRSLPISRKISRAPTRTLPDRCRVRPAWTGLGRGRRQRQRFTHRRGRDPPADADRLPQERDTHPALDGCRS